MDSTSFAPAINVESINYPIRWTEAGALWSGSGNPTKQVTAQSHSPGALHIDAIMYDQMYYEVSKISTKFSCILPRIQ